MSRDYVDAEGTAESLRRCYVDYLNREYTKDLILKYFSGGCDGEEREAGQTELPITTV